MSKWTGCVFVISIDFVMCGIFNRLEEYGFINGLGSLGSFNGICGFRFVSGLGVLDVSIEGCFGCFHRSVVMSVSRALQVNNVSMRT